MYLMNSKKESEFTNESDPIEAWMASYNPYGTSRKCLFNFHETKVCQCLGPVFLSIPTNVNSNRILNNQLEWPENPAEGLLNPNQWAQIADVASLTQRERQVAEMLLESHTREEIAQKLNVKPRTIRQHMESLHSKLKVSNRVGLALRVISLRDQVIQNDHLHELLIDK